MALTKVLITVKTYPALSEKYEENEKLACKKVKQRYFDDFVKNKDLHFSLGTTRQFHKIAPNPFIIIGTFYPPKEKENPQLSLFYIFIGST